MDWTHALAALFGAVVGAIADMLYAHWRRRSYWSDFYLTLQNGKRRQNSMRTHKSSNRARFYGRSRLSDLQEFDV
jgi:hypothetical protein